MDSGTNSLRVTLLGSPRLVWEGARIEAPTRKGMALVCYLAAGRKAVDRSELAALLWGESANGLANLRWELHHLRQLPGADSWLGAEAGGAKVAVRADSDLEDLEVAMRGGWYEQALDLVRGSGGPELLAGLAPRGAPAFDEWLTDERQRVAALVQRAIRGRATELERAGTRGEARALALEAVALDPLDEASHRLAIRLALLQNDLPAAAEQFETCRRLMASELGLTLTPETLALGAAIERALASAPPTPGATRRIPPELLRPPVLVGREVEWARLEAAWQRRQLVFVSGQPGVGKTRLVQDFIRAKVGDDVAVLPGLPSDRLVPFSGYARGWRGVYERKPHLVKQLAPWVRTEAARFLPELAEAGPPARPADADELRFGAAMRELYLQLLSSFGAALVDDIQYFDPTSWRVGGASLLELYSDPRRVGTLGRMLIVFRTDEMPPSFIAGIGSLVATGAAVHIELGPLGRKSIAALVSSLMPSQEGAADNAGAAAHLERLTGGNPLYLVELLRKLFETGAWDGDGQPDLEGMGPELLPESVHSAIWRRLQRLSGEAQRTARALAVLQEGATTARLARLLELDEPTLAVHLSELEEAQVVADLRFSHDLLQESVLRSLPRPVARLLHARAALLLEAESAAASRVAHHWYEAGEAERAAAHYLTAAELALASGARDSVKPWLDLVLRHASGALRARASALSDALQD